MRSTLVDLEHVSPEGMVLPNPEQIYYDILEGRAVIARLPAAADVFDRPGAAADSRRRR